MGFFKTAKSEVAETVDVASCPICSSVTTHMYYMQDAETKIRSKWYSCHCGVIWQMGEPKEPYDQKYFDRYKDGGKKYASAVKYPVQVYMPLIEELMYGRRVLEVGHTSPYQVETMKERGWVPTTIDKNPCFTPSDTFIVDDFETHDFGDQKFNLIWLNHTLECFSNPKESLTKCFSLLPEDGILVIMTPDTDFLHTRSSSGFIHWKPQTNRLMWNGSALTSYLERLGFQTIMCRRNYEHRFAAQDDIHGIWQKKFF